MKRLNHKVLLPLFALTASGLLGSCGTDTSSPVGEDGVVLDFVACTDSSWDAEVTLGSFVYQFDVKLKDDNSVSLEADCLEEAQQGGQGGGPGGPGGGFPGGPGGPGGGFPGGPGGGGQQEATSSKEPMSEAELEKQDFTIGGTWELEEGYGYILNLSDATKSVIHVDYNLTQGRHEFYYQVPHGDDKATVLFQAKDSGFRNSLAADYKTWDERDSKHIFIGETTGNNGSVAHAYLYCHSDGSAKFDTASRSSRVITLGLTWTETNGKFVLKDEAGTEYTAENSINTSHPGYRLSYDDTALFCSTGSIDSLDMTNEDFDGKTLYQFTGEYTTTGPDGKTNEVELNLTENENKMFLYVSGKLNTKGTYSFANEVFTLNFDGKEPAEVSKNADGKYVYTFKIIVQSFFGTQEIDCELTYPPGA